MELSKNDERVSGLISMAFGKYNGRRPVKVRASEQYHLADYWDGGSKTEARFVHLPTRRLIDKTQMGYEHQSQGNPFNLAVGNVRLSPETAVIEHIIFCGKNMGIRIVLHPETYKEWFGNGEA